MKKTHRNICILIIVAILLLQLFSALCLRSHLNNRIEEHIDEIYEQNHPMNKVTVYTTRTGEKYHSGSCHYLAKSKLKTTLRKAVLADYTACSACDTPYYLANYDGIDTFAEYKKAGYLNTTLQEYQVHFTLLFVVIPITLAVLIIGFIVQLVIGAKKAKLREDQNLGI